MLKNTDWIMDCALSWHRMIKKIKFL